MKSKYNLRSKYNFGTSRNITALHKFYSELTEHYPFYAAPCSAILCQIACLVDTFCGKNKPDPCQQDTFRAFFNYLAIKPLFVAERLSYFRIVEKVVFVQVFFVKRLYVGLCSQPRIFERRFCP